MWSFLKSEFEKTDALWGELKSDLLNKGWVEEKEDRLYKRYQTGIGEQFDEIIFSKEQCFEPTQHGHGREMLLFTRCDEHFCNNWCHYIWKINADVGLFKSWRHNGRQFWLILETKDDKEFRLDFSKRVADADEARKPFEKHY